MSIIRSVVRDWHKEHVEGELNHQDQLNLVLALFEGKSTEENLAGTFFLQEILLPAGVVKCKRDIDRFAVLFASHGACAWRIAIKKIFFVRHAAKEKGDFFNIVIKHQDEPINAFGKKTIQEAT